LLYSTIFLKYIGALDHETFFAIEKIASQLEVMLAQKTSDFSAAESVISVIEALVKRMCKV
jgi:predicted transcriptional regulator